MSFTCHKHLIVDLSRVFLAFTTNTDIPHAADAYYADVNTRLNLTKNASYTSATVLADALLVRVFLLICPHLT